MDSAEQPIGAGTKLSRKARTSYRDLDDGGVLLDLETGDYHSLNRTGAAIWKLLEDEPTLSGLVRELEAMLDDPPPALERDVTQFLERMRQGGLVTIREA